MQILLLPMIHWSLEQGVLTCSRRTRNDARLNDSMTLNLCRLTFGIGETDKIYPKKDNFVSLKGIEMRKVHSQWKMSRIGSSRRENLRHKFAFTLPVKIIILKSHTIFFRFLCFKTGRQFGRDPATTYFHFFLKNWYFCLIICVSEELEKSENNLISERMDVVLTSSLFESFCWYLFSTFQHWFPSISHEFADDQRRRAPRRDITDLKEM